MGSVVTTVDLGKPHISTLLGSKTASRDEPP